MLKFYSGGFAMLTCSDRYAPSMTRFLNKFAKDMQDASDEEIQLLEKIFSAFLDICHDFPTGIFGTKNKVRYHNKKIEHLYL